MFSGETYYILLGPSTGTLFGFSELNIVFLVHWVCSSIQPQSTEARCLGSISRTVINCGLGTCTLYLL